ncbi:GNAT family N-acetyltransferase [Corynebacterium sp. BCW_4722]|nr:GNAT family N-acetyltransferase [Corynebacterium sp. BCW_4722]
MNTPIAFTLREATESDRTYLRRLNYLTEVFGDEEGTIGEKERDGSDIYVGEWDPERESGVIAFDQFRTPAGGVWLRYWATPEEGNANLGPDIPELAIAVENRYAGHQLAVQLLDAAADLARRQGAPKLALWVDPGNPRARHRYETFGFTDVEGHDNVMALDLARG